MIEKLTPPKSARKFSLKNWVAYVLFGAIILVFAFFGINPDRFGRSEGGVVASVNAVPISLAEYRQRVESIEQNSQLRLDQFPEAQRKALSAELRRRALEDLVLSEVVFQAAEARGVKAADAEVRDYILQIPVLQENGKFQRQRYEGLLRNMNMGASEFERQIRKQLVSQRLQQLFVTAAMPANMEVGATEKLSRHKLNVRFVSLNEDVFKSAAFLPANEVKQFVIGRKAEIDKYYQDNQIEFKQSESVKARHILIRIDDKRSETQAKAAIEALKKQVTPQNFATLATKNSDDPGSKVKGGDLGEFGRGRMLPEFEKVAFTLKPGQISDPVKTEYGYHLIFVEGKTPEGTRSLELAQEDIARKLMAKEATDVVLKPLTEALKKGDRKAVDQWVKAKGLKWSETGDFDLTQSSIPKLGESSEIVDEVVALGPQGGLVSKLIANSGQKLIVDAASWKMKEKNVEPKKGLTPAANEEKDAQRLAYRKSSDLIQAWSKQAQENAKIVRSSRM